VCGWLAGGLTVVTAATAAQQAMTKLLNTNTPNGVLSRDSSTPKSCCSVLLLSVLQRQGKHIERDDE
jgi:hypothetical protein